MSYENLCVIRMHVYATHKGEHKHLWSAVGKRVYLNKHIELVFEPWVYANKWPEVGCIVLQDIYGSINASFSSEPGLSAAQYARHTLYVTFEDSQYVDGEMNVTRIFEHWPEGFRPLALPQSLLDNN